MASWFYYSEEEIHNMVDSASLQEFGKAVRLTQPNMCKFCINIASVFSIPDSTVRIPGHPALSSIIYMHSIVTMVESAETCPMCSLIAYQLDKNLLFFLSKVIPFRVRRSSEAQDPLTSKAQTSLNNSRENMVIPLNKKTDLVFKKESGDLLDLYSAWNGAKASCGITVTGINVEDIASYYRFLEDDYLTIKDFHGSGNQIGGFHLGSLHFGSTTLSEKSLRVFTNRAEAALDNIAEREVMPNANNSLTLNLAKDWITACYNNHPECIWSSAITGGEDPVLPERVIDVSPTQHISASSDVTVRLVSTHQSRGKWVALSHRWGVGDVLQLLERNRQTLKEGINVSSLPATFRDAVEITRALGIRYLWIDSLCIIQDSPTDWQAESAKMPEIYQNAYTTIAAAATDSTHGGILVERECLSASPKRCTLPIIRDGKRVSVMLDILPKLLGDVERNLLKTRAWCLQESQLSRRLLTFDKIQMSFTCLRHGLLESREASEASAKEEKNSFLPALLEASNKDPVAKRRALLITWYQVLADYTSRDLTFQEDKLVAISGIAQIIGDYLDDEYHAGIWANNLPQGLLWSPYEEETFPNPPHKATLPHDYRAPSWSWASVESPIAGFLCKMTFQAKPLATVLDVQVELRGSNKYGQVTSGHLEIKGCLREFRVGKALESWPWQPEISSIPSSPHGGNNIQEPTCVGHGIFDIEWPEIGTTVWLLQITKVYSLILEHADGSNDLIFKRLGVAHLSKDPFVRTDEETIIVL